MLNKFNGQEIQVNGEPKSLAEANGLTYSQRVEGAYASLKGHMDWLRAFEHKELQEEVDIAEKRRQEISEEQSQSLQDFWRVAIAQDAELSVNSIDEFVRIYQYTQFNFWGWRS